MITDPSVFTAAKAEPVEYTATTLLDMFKDTEEESPPRLEFPQVTTDPSVFKAAKAPPQERFGIMLGSFWEVNVGAEPFQKSIKND